MTDQILNYFIYIISAVIIIYVLNRYFSGAKFTGMKSNLWGSVAVITGGNTGIGKETVIDLAQHGCRVIIGARDTKKSEAVVEQVNKTLGKNMVEQYRLDLSDIESIKDFVSKINAQKIDFLINNAGIMALPKRTVNKSGYQMQYATNHLGHFYLTHLLWPKLQKSDFFRIINVSSLAHKKQLGFFKAPNVDFDDMNFEKYKYSPTLAYSRSKIYNNLFTHALTERIPENKGMAFSLHPGVVRTELIRYMVTGVVSTFLWLVHPIYAIFTKSPLQGAQTTLSLVYTPANKLKNGGFYADCRISSENKNVIKENWDKLWEISERDLNIKFGSA